MKDEEILEGNKLIAEFMGVKIGIDKYSWRPGVIDPLREEHLAYHKEWGWLMPVVEKIEWEHGKLFVIEGFACTVIAAANENPRVVPFKIKKHTNKKIDSVYQAVISFIKWYNLSDPLTESIKL